MVFSESGTFYARAFTASGALPSEGVLVRICGADEENRDFERSLLTDASGLTEVVSLPAPPRELSLHYGSANTPYAIYDVSVLSDGYYPKNFYNVAVFSGTEAYLPVSMIPLTGTESAPEGNLSIVITENGYLEG